MGRWADYKAWRERRKELVAEDQDRALAREARRVREAFASAEGSGPAVEVRWGLAEDGARIADLLELNGMPRWVAFEELFVVADERGEVTAAVRYRIGRERLLLGLLVADPWRDRGALAEVLYSGARALAWESGIPRVVARGPENPRRAREAGFRRRGRDLQADATSEATAVAGSLPRPPGGSWRRVFSLWGRLGIPFFGTTPDGDAGR
jgi:hypothetical protein